MSRCFPFPPPGYEANHRSEDTDLLKKEKQKIEKHKKERKDGGKRERKEKSRDHRKDKHKRKHKREKHKDRTKKKERDKERRQNFEQGTKKNDDRDKRRPKQILHNEAVKDSKYTDEFTSQITVQKGHANITGSSTGKLLARNIESFSVVGSEEKERSSISRTNEKSEQIGQNHASENGKNKTRVLNCKSPQGRPAEKYSTGIRGSNGVGLQQESSKAVLASATAIQQKRRITSSTNAAQRTEQVDQHTLSSSHSAYGKSGIMTTMTEKKNVSANSLHSRVDKELVGGKKGAVQGNPKIKEGKTNHQKVIKDGDRDHDVNHKAVKDRDRYHNAKKRKARDGKKAAVQGNAMIKEEKPNHQKSVKDGDRDHNVNHKALKDTDIDHNVKKRKAKAGNEDKVRDKRSFGHEHKRKELDGHGTRKTHEIDSAHLNGNKFTSDDVKKRKDLNTNSSLHEHSMRMTKMPKTSPANHLLVNEETLKHSQGTAPYSSTLPVGTPPCEADILQDVKECYNNGITGPHYLEKHKSSVRSSSYDGSEVCLTQPHLDTKYLSQVYSIPAVDDCAQYNDQDWLFSGDQVHQKSTVLEAAEPAQVWAEAQPIDSADVVAMPYVVLL